MLSSSGCYERALSRRSCSGNQVNRNVWRRRKVIAGYDFRGGAAILCLLLTVFSRRISERLRLADPGDQQEYDYNDWRDSVHANPLSQSAHQQWRAAGFCKRNRKQEVETQQMNEPTITSILQMQSAAGAVRLVIPHPYWQPCLDPAASTCRISIRNCLVLGVRGQVDHVPSRIPSQFPPE